MDPFHPIDGSTVTCSVTTTSGDFPFIKTQQGRHQIRFYNAGAVPVFWRKGSGGVAATAVVTDTPIAPGATEVFTVNNTDKSPITSVGIITGSSTATVYVTQGDGI